MSKEDIKKAIGEIVGEYLTSKESPENKESAAEDVEKAMPTSLPESGGGDKIRSGSPYSEKQKMEEGEKAKKMKKAEDEKDEDDDEKEDEKMKKMKDSKKMKKMEDDGEPEKEMKKMSHDKKTKKMGYKMNKSLEELSEHLDDEELALIKAWRDDKEAEESEVGKLAKSLEESMKNGYEDLKKVVADQAEIIKGLSDKIEKVAKQPAYSKRSLSTLEALEKSDSKPEVSKRKVVDKLLEMQLAGEGINSLHVAEYESTGNISDPRVREKVLAKFS